PHHPFPQSEVLAAGRVNRNHPLAGEVHGTAEACAAGLDREIRPLDKVAGAAADLLKHPIPPFFARGVALGNEQPPAPFVKQSHTEMRSADIHRQHVIHAHALRISRRRGARSWSYSPRARASLRSPPPRQPTGAGRRCSQSRYSNSFSPRACSGAEGRATDPSYAGRILWFVDRN